jgi:hypothetical protein
MVGSYREPMLPLFIRRASSGGLVITYWIPAPLLFSGHISVSFASRLPIEEKGNEGAEYSGGESKGESSRYEEG